MNTSQNSDFFEFEDHINMSRPIVNHFQANEVLCAEVEKPIVSSNRRPPDQDFWDEKTQTKEFARK